MTTMWEYEMTLDKDIYCAALVFSWLHHLSSEELLEVLWLFSLQQLDYLLQLFFETSNQMAHLESKANKAISLYMKKIKSWYENKH